MAQKTFSFENFTFMHLAIARASQTLRGERYKVIDTTPEKSLTFDYAILDSDEKIVGTFSGRNEPQGGTLTFESTSAMAPLLTQIITRAAHDSAGREAGNTGFQAKS